MKLSPDVHVYGESEKIVLTVSPQRERFLTLFGIGPAGDVNFLYPLVAYKDPPSLPDGQEYNVATTVHPPFGAEHFVAIASREQPLHLQKMLQQMDRQILSPESVKRLAAEIRASGGRVGLIQGTTEAKTKM